MMRGLQTRRMFGYSGCWPADQCSNIQYDEFYETVSHGYIQNVQHPLQLIKETMAPDSLHLEPWRRAVVVQARNLEAKETT
jgi:hypothetical protein